MKSTIKKLLLWILALTLGGLWAYSFVTRIGLFFLIPLWLKALVISFLTINLSMLARTLIKHLRQRLDSKPAWVWLLIGAALISAVFFLILPYQRMTFPTTHTLTIKALDYPVTLTAVTSPDDNLISQDAFEAGPGATPSGEQGFILSPEAVLSYQREQNGGLTLYFQLDSGTAEITWDGETHQLPMAQDLLSQTPDIGNWRTYTDFDTGQIRLLLPGNTLGEPSPFWLILALLMPLADFITLTSITAGLVWVGLMLRQEKHALISNFPNIATWIISAAVLWLTVILFEIGLPNFIPGWFLALFLPLTAYLSADQINILVKSGLVPKINAEQLENIKQKINTGLKRININHSAWACISVLLLMVLAGSWSLYQITGPGMGVSGDSVHYLEGAQNIAAGLGYVRTIKIGTPVPITGWPPGYAALLSLGAMLGFDLLAFARWLNILLYNLLLFGIGWLTFKQTRSVMAAAVAGIFSLFSLPLFSVYAWVLSETIFLVLMMGAFLLLRSYLKKESWGKFAALTLISICILQTRLAGMAVVATIALSLVIFTSGAKLARWVKAIAYGLISVAPLGLFFYRNSQIGESVSEFRSFNLAPFKPIYWQTIFDQTAAWLKLQFFTHQQGVIIALFFIIFAAFSVLFLLNRFRQKQSPSETSKIQDIFFLFFFVYLLMIILNIVILTPKQALEDMRRFMLPLFPVFIIWGTTTLTKATRRSKNRMLSTSLFVSGIILLSLYSADFFQLIQSPPKRFRAYTDILIDCQDQQNIFDNIPVQANVYTNNCEFNHFASGQRCIHLPVTPESFQPDGEVYEDIAEGDIIVVMAEYGYNPPGLNAFLDDLTLYQSGCLLSFYQWPNTP